jgi:hypothetical protein
MVHGICGKNLYGDCLLKRVLELSGDSIKIEKIET